jgi:flagellar biosynthesis GTPase FlhF
VAGCRRELEAALIRRRDAERVFVDTPGLRCFDAAARDWLQAALPPDAARYLVLPATADARYAQAVIAGVRAVGVDRVVLTKLDEVRPAGPACAYAAADVGPCEAISRGVGADDLSPADPRVLACLALGMDPDPAWLAGEPVAGRV